MRRKVFVIIFTAMLFINGCTQSTSEETPVTETPSVIATEPIEVETTTPATSEATIDTATIQPSTESMEDNSTSSEVNEDGFKTVNVSGLFDIQVLDPLPEQMTLEIRDIDYDGYQGGSINLVVHSSDSGCSTFSTCNFIIYGFDWYTDGAREIALKTFTTPEDDNFIQEYDTEIGHIGLYRDYVSQISAYIEDGNGPDYFYDEAGGQLTYAVDDLIRFDKD